MKQPLEWDAGTYHRVSTPQQTWGARVVERLELRGGERVLDAGCGTGRVTLALLERVRAVNGHVVAIDRSHDMTRTARTTLPADVPVVAADLLAMPFRAAFDIVFSTATLHWVLDQPALYRALARVLAPGGRLLAQCGGEGNVGTFHARAMALSATPRFASRFAGWSDPWRFLSEAAAERLLRAAGFEHVRTWLEPQPTTFADRAAYREFSEKVVLGAWMTRFEGAPADASAFVDVLCEQAAADQPPFTLDYVRLNVEAALGRSAA